MSLRTQLRKNEDKRIEKLQFEMEVEALYRKISKGDTVYNTLRQISKQEVDDLYKLTYVRENLYRNYWFNKFHEKLPIYWGIEGYRVFDTEDDPRTKDDPLSYSSRYVPMYFLKSLDMPFSLHLPTSLYLAITRGGLKLNNWFGDDVLIKTEKDHIDEFERAKARQKQDYNDTEQYDEKKMDEIAKKLEAYLSRQNR